MPESGDDGFEPSGRLEACQTIVAFLGRSDRANDSTIAIGVIGQPLPAGGGSADEISNRKGGRLSRGTRVSVRRVKFAGSRQRLLPGKAHDLTPVIQAYHAIPKDALNRRGDRMARLRQINALAARCLQLHGVANRSGPLEGTLGFCMRSLAGRSNASTAIFQPAREYATCDAGRPIMT